MKHQTLKRDASLPRTSGREEKVFLFHSENTAIIWRRNRFSGTLLCFCRIFRCKCDQFKETNESDKGNKGSKSTYVPVRHTKETNIKLNFSFFSFLSYYTFTRTRKKTHSEFRLSYPNRHPIANQFIIIRVWETKENRHLWLHHSMMETKSWNYWCVKAKNEVREIK